MLYAFMSYAILFASSTECEKSLIFSTAARLACDPLQRHSAQFVLFLFSTNDRNSTWMKTSWFLQNKTSWFLQNTCLVDSFKRMLLRSPFLLFRTHSSAISSVSIETAIKMPHSTCFRMKIIKFRSPFSSPPGSW